MKRKAVKSAHTIKGTRPRPSIWGYRNGIRI